MAQTRRIIPPDSRSPNLTTIPGDGSPCGEEPSSRDAADRQALNVRAAYGRTDRSAPHWNGTAARTSSTSWQMPIQDVQPRVEDLAALALKTAARRGRKPSTLENKRNCWEAKIVPAFRGQVAALISHDEAQDAAESWAESFGPHAALKAAREAKHGWGLALARGWLLRSPWGDIHVPGAVRGEQRFMPAEARAEFRAFLEPVALRGVSCKFRRVTCLALLFLAEVPAGRSSETAALEQRGVDLGARVVTWYRHKTDGTVGPKHSPLTDYAAAIASTAMELAPGNRWVFPSHSASGGHVRALCKSMSRVCAHIGTGHYTPHDVRRGIAQEAIDAGVSMEDLSAMLAHESVKTTEAYVRWSRPRAARGLRLVTFGGAA